MAKSFGQFRKQQKERSLLSPEDRAFVKAFNQGAEAGRMDLPRSSPYRPEGEQAKHEAWLCGYDEVAPRYTAAR